MLPWVDLSQAQFATMRVDRAEPQQSGLVRPDNAFLDVQGRLMVGWPTKLALAPDFADRVLASLSRDDIHPIPQPTCLGLPRPPMAKPVWDVLLP